MNIAVPWRHRLGKVAATSLVVGSALIAIPGSAAAATLELTADDVTVGGAITAAATLSGGTDASGTIEFEVFAPDDASCANALAPSPSAVTVSGDGSYQSGAFPTGEVGDYRWSAHYLGDLNNPAIDLDCAASSTVTKASPTISALATDGLVGGTIMDEAVLIGAFAPTQEVTFSVFGPGDAACETPLRTDTSPLSGSAAISFGFTPPVTGEYRWIVSYPGDSNNEPVSIPCGVDANQSSAVAKVVPTLTATATSAIQVGQPIADIVNLSGGFEAGGQLTFRAFGPNDAICASTPAYEETVAVDGDGAYEAAGFRPSPGLYLWTVTYGGDEANAAVELPCGSVNQASAVGTLTMTLTAGASGSTVGGPATATATLGGGAVPGGQLTFMAFSPDDPACSGVAAFSSTVNVSGNGSYSSASFIPSEVGTYRWTVSYSGDVNHAVASAACGAASSAVAKAVPTVSGKVGDGKRLTAGTRFRDSVILTGGFRAGGTITFQIFGPGEGANRCERPAFVNSIRVNGNGTYNSDPFVARQAGRYRFRAIYSGDTRNVGAAESCSAPEQLARVKKRSPKLLPIPSLVASHQISVRARLSGTSSPSGSILYRLFAPGDRRCIGRPAFSGSLRVAGNGTFNLAEYIATRPGQYRLAVAYSGDPRNARTRINCSTARVVTVRN